MNLLNSLGIVGPNIIHAEQGMCPDGKNSDDDTWDGPGTCVCRLPWPCEAQRLGEVVAALSRPSGSIDVPTLAEAIAAVDIGLPPGNPQRAHWRTSPGQVAHATEIAAEYARLTDEAAG